MFVWWMTCDCVVSRIRLVFSLMFVWWMTCDCVVSRIRLVFSLMFVWWMTCDCVVSRIRLVFSLMFVWWMICDCVVSRIRLVFSLMFVWWMICDGIVSRIRLVFSLMFVWWMTCDCVVSSIMLVFRLLLASANGPAGSNKCCTGLYVLYWASYRAGALIIPRLTNAHACLYIPLVSVFVRSWACWVIVQISCVLWCFMISQLNSHNAFKISIQSASWRITYQILFC